MAKRRIPQRSLSHPPIAPRMILVASVLFLAFAAVVVQAARLQLVERHMTDRYVRRARSTEVITTNARRGTIFDRNGKELAVDVAVQSAYIDPLFLKKSPNVSGALNQIASITHVPSKTLKRRLKKSQRFFWVKRKLSPSIVARLKALNIEGLHFVEESKRYYPNGPLAANLLGFTNLDGEGIEGLEYTFNEALGADKQIVRGQRDARGREILSGGITKTGAAGHNLTLTIDNVLQYIAETELDRTMEETQAASAMVIMMVPNTGEILAMASRPTYDPNRYSDYAPQQRRNRPVTDVFEPGSTFKAFVLATAVDRGVVSVNDRFFCKAGSLAIRSKIINESHAQEWLQPREILKFSSNIGAAKIGLLLGAGAMEELVRRFGFGVKTGVGIVGEVSGIVHSRRNWNEYDIASLAFGQGVGVTSLQMVRSFAALVNGGFLLRPYLVDSVKSIDGRVVHKGERHMLDKVVATSTSVLMRELLKSVVEPGGTGVRARLAQYTVGGKTGTAQRFDTEAGMYTHDYTSSFIGFFPADEPQLLILALVDQPKGRFTSSSYVAAPLFHRIAAAAAQVLHMESDRPVRELRLVDADVPSQVRRVAHRAGKTHGALFKGLTVREALVLAREKGLQPTVRGSGFATGVLEWDPVDRTRVTLFFNHARKQGG